MKPNTQFELSVDDVELIENALTAQLIRATDQNDDHRVKEIHELLGHIHNQKIWYRPTKSTYVGG